jgi:hypothetical protein
MMDTVAQRWEYCDFLVTEVSGQARLLDETQAEREEEETALALQGRERSAIAEAGENGWELVSVVPLMIGGTTLAERYIFKRPRQ